VATADRVYAVVIVDLVRSRRLPADALAAVHRRLTGLETDAAVVLPFRPTTGDEWEGVVAGAAAAYRIVRRWQEAIHPQRLRAGVGIGPLADPLGPDPREMTGPPFYAARAAIAEAKATDRLVVFRRAVPGGAEPPGRVRSGDAGHPALDTANVLAELIHLGERRWSPRQREIASLYGRLGSVTQTAERLGVRPPAVTIALRRAGYHPLMRGVSHLLTLLEGFDRACLP
jgi:hypothetical protein